MRFRFIFQTLISKIIYKIGLLVVIIIAFIICSFMILAYFQSQQTLLGNSINIAGKTRFLTMSVLFQTSEYLNGILSSISSHSTPVSSSTSSTVRLNDAMINLNASLLALRDGGKTSNLELELKPLPSKYLDSWKIINNNWNRLTTFITYDILKPAQQQKGQQLQLKTFATATIPTTAIAAAAKLYTSTKIKLESLALNVINSSDRLVTQLGNDTAKDSRNLVLLEIFLAVLNIGVVILILYFVIKILKPIDTLTRATSEIKKGNFDVPIQKHKGDDELSLLSESFNSMVQSIKNYITTQNQLTSELKELNERLKYKDQLKDQFVYTSAHELRNPIQPILGLSEFMRYRKPDEDTELFDIIIRNAKRLGGLSEKILDIQKIENRTLMLEKERFNINEMVRNIINEIKLKDNKIEIIFVKPKVDPMIVEADRMRIYEVILNLLSNAIKFTKKSSTADSTFYGRGSNAIIIFTTIKSNQDKVNDKSVDEIVISIRDRGTGIDPKIQEELFSIFVTKSGTGSGLGLFISKGIVEAHGGKVWAENNAEGKGATFSFTLPISH